jgi:GNAT superfamily N-acetyltransferase
MGEASLDLPRRIAEAYRWHRRLGARGIEAPHCHIVADPSMPEVWDCNHVDTITARASAEIDLVFVAMDHHLAHSRWRVAHTDSFTPEPFLARLAFAEFRERPVTIQMALVGEPSFRGTSLDLRVVEGEADWAVLAKLARANHEEGLTTGGLEIEPGVSEAIVAGYRAKTPDCQFHLVHEAGTAIAYGASAAAPNGLGMIEDVFTSPAFRRRGVASAMIATLAARLREGGCDAVFLGALAEEQAKHIYARLGFEPVSLGRAWVKDTLKSAR